MFLYHTVAWKAFSLLADCRCKMKIHRLSVADIFINLLHPLSVSCHSERFQICLLLTKFKLLVKKDSSVNSSTENSDNIPTTQSTRDGYNSMMQESCVCKQYAFIKKKASYLSKQKKNPHMPPKMRKIKTWVNSIFQGFAGIVNLENENPEGNRHKTRNNIPDSSGIHWDKSFCL